MKSSDLNTMTDREFEEYAGNLAKKRARNFTIAAAAIVLVCSPFLIISGLFILLIILLILAFTVPYIIYALGFRLGFWSSDKAREIAAGVHDDKIERLCNKMRLDGSDEDDKPNAQREARLRECPACGHIYDPWDYSKTATEIFCGQCKAELPLDGVND